MRKPPAYAVHADVKLPDDLGLKEKIQLMSGRTSLIKIAWDMFVLRHYNRKPYPAGGNRRLGIPRLLFSDGPRGVVMGRSTCFPVAMARGASWDTALEERIGEAIAREILYQGGNFFGGVCINILRHPAWGRSQETYGEDPHHLGAMGSALVRGIQQLGVMACVKHFAANSMENARFKVNVTMDDRTLREVYLPHFKRCIDEGAAAVMGAYNRFRGEYCCENAFLLSRLLRDEWGFEGITVSDFVYGIHDTARAVNAGMDVEMPDSRHYGKTLLAAVRKGAVSEEVIDRSARRIMRTILSFSRRMPPKEEIHAIKPASPEHTYLARKAAEKSMVLLKNEGPLLPFHPAQLKTLAVIGPLADAANIGDRGSSLVHPPYVVTPLQGIRCFAGKNISVTYTSGADLEKASSTAAAADAVVLVCGYTHDDEGEYMSERTRIGGDRENLALRTSDERLIRAVAEANPKTAVVLIGGSAVIIEFWKNLVPAVLLAWYPGMEGGTALANILFGNVNPSGKLPFTIPKREEDLPFFDRNADEIEYGYFHGYSCFEENGVEPAFPFGYGLSYTLFRHSNLRARFEEGRICAEWDVQNEGNIPGAEIPQCYTGFPGTQVKRWKKKLIGFERIHLMPGESKTVFIESRKEDLLYYDAGTNSWKFEEGPVTVYAGSSSRDCDLLKQNVRVK